MSFWAYMLHCRGGYFYTGHTDDLETRIAQHQDGKVPGFTAEHQPVELVWSEAFQTRQDARLCERQLKGWSRVKKLALIRGDWDRVSALAKKKARKKARKKDSASTSSAWAGEGDTTPNSDHPELVEGLRFSLQPHPATPPLRLTSIEARISRHEGGWLTLRWKLTGSSKVQFPTLAGKARTNELWRTTCFELFISSASGPEYCEFNLSPSEQWAAYDFTGYRSGMRDRAVAPEPVCTLRPGRNSAIFDAAIPLGDLPALPWRYGLSAVTEEEGGVLSYWAIAHPPGKPDFHDPACFAATLAAPVGA